MKKVVILNYQDILNKKFSASLKGYNPLEVDLFLDQVLYTIDLKDKKIDSLTSEVQSLKKSLDDLTEKNKNISREFSFFKKRFKNINEDDVLKNVSTIELIQKVNVYERKLNELGVDLKDLLESQSKWLLAYARGKSMLAHCWDACSVCARRKNNSRYYIPRNNGL